jgi:hypothetical protein
LGLLSALMIVSPLASLVPSAAQAASINTAIRGTSVNTVYWYANDGKRYVFPNTTVFYSWFPNFNNVQTVSDSELYAIQIGGNVTMRPGANLVKVATDPKTYAVSRGGILHWVTSESLASQLFGWNWNTKVVDVADSYFTNYTVGAPIYSTSDYNVSNEYNGVSNPGDSLRGMTSNGTNTGSITLNVSRTSINPGDAVTVSVSNVPTYGSGYRLEIYDTRNNNLVYTCTLPSSYCSTTVYPQRNNSENSVQYYAALRDSSSATIQSGYSQVVYFYGSNGGSSLSNTGSRFTTTISRSSINSGDSVTFTANLTSGYGLSSNYRIDIQDPRTNTSVQTCWNTSYCSGSTSIYATNGTNVTFTARLLDGNGNLITTDSFPTVYVGGSSTGGAFSSGSSRLDVDKTSVSAGQQVVLTATATNLTTDVSNIRMELYNADTNALLDTCYDRAVCSFTQTVYGNNTSSGARYYVLVKNDAGETIPAAYSPRITVNGSTQNNGQLTLWTDRTSINSGDTVSVSAWASSSFNASRIEVYDERNNTLVFTCYNVASCNQSRQIYRNGSESSMRYVAYLKDWNGSTIAMAYSSYISFTGTNGGYSNNGQLSINANPTTVSAGQSATINAYYSGSFPTNGRLVITQTYAGSSPSTVQTCYTNSCSATVWPSNSGYSQSYTATVYDSYGSLIASTNSITVSVNGSNGTSYNDGVNYINGLVLQADRTSINAGETVHLTANAYNAGTWSYTGNRIEIRDINTGSIVKTCYDQSWCMIDVYPVAQSSGNLTAQYQARIYDRNGNLAMSQYSPVIYLSNYNGSNYNNYNGNSSINGNGYVTIAPTSQLRPNGTVYLTATFTGTNLDQSNAMIQIYTEQSSTPVATCNGAFTCSVSYPTGSSPINTRVYARLTDRNNSSRWMETSRTSLVTTW